MPDIIDGLDGVFNAWEFEMKTTSVGGYGKSTAPRTILQWFWDTENFSFIGIWSTPRQYRKDFTDGAGHGMLIGVDSLFARLASTATGSANTAYIRLYYRFKEVSLTEYVGIVQSQQ